MLGTWNVGVQLSRPSVSFQTVYLIPYVSLRASTRNRSWHKDKCTPCRQSRKSCRHCHVTLVLLKPSPLALADVYAAVPAPHRHRCYQHFNSVRVPILYAASCLNSCPVIPRFSPIASLSLSILLYSFFSSYGTYKVFFTTPWRRRYCTSWTWSNQQIVCNQYTLSTFIYFSFSIVFSFIARAVCFVSRVSLYKFIIMRTRPVSVRSIVGKMDLRQQCAMLEVRPPPPPYKPNCHIGKLYVYFRWQNAIQWETFLKEGEDEWAKRELWSWSRCHVKDILLLYSRRTNQRYGSAAALHMRYSDENYYTQERRDTER